MKLELSILDYIHKHLRSLSGDIVMPFISALGNGGFIWLVVIAGLSARKPIVLRAFAWRLLLPWGSSWAVLC